VGDDHLEACLKALLTRRVDEARRELAEIAAARPDAVQARLPAIAEEAAGKDAVLRLRAAEVFDVVSQAGLDIG